MSMFACIRKGSVAAGRMRCDRVMNEGRSSTGEFSLDWFRSPHRPASKSSDCGDMKRATLTRNTNLTFSLLAFCLAWPRLVRGRHHTSIGYAKRSRLMKLLWYERGLEMKINTFIRSRAGRKNASEDEAEKMMAAWRRFPPLLHSVFI